MVKAHLRSFVLDRVFSLASVDFAGKTQSISPNKIALGWENRKSPQTADWLVVSSIPLALPKRVGMFAIPVDKTGFVAIYHETGELWYVADTRDGKSYFPPFAESSFTEGIPDWERAHIRANEEKVSDTSCVYFLGDIEIAIKIGVSIDARARLKEIQSCSPVKLHLLATLSGGARREAAYHAQFTAHRLHGEWFSPHPDILAEIARLNDPQQHRAGAR